MVEFTLDLQESIQSVEQRRVAHDWVTSLAKDLLHPVEDGNYAEFTLGTDRENVTELLEVMGLDDLLVKPGDRLGKVYSIEYEGDHPEHDDKMGVWLGSSFLVPRQPDRIFVAAAVEQFDPEEAPVHYVSIGLEYSRGRDTFRQMIGVAAHPDEWVDALRLEYGVATTGASILKKADARPISQSDTWTFVDCLRELFVLNRDQLV